MGENMRDKLTLVKKEIKKVIFGKDEVIDSVLVTILAGGHVLLEDIPGVGKTTLALAFSKTLSLGYRRMQFTPDTLPSDVTGFSVYNKETGEFEYREGAVMANLFLADEINRTSPKTQSALLEVMEESKVTVDGVSHPLPEPFFVIATQNPLGSVGTQKLPESQLDRFMVRLTMGYPDPESESIMLRAENADTMSDVKAVVTPDELNTMIKTVNSLFADDKIFDYIAAVSRASRESEWLKTGISPRGSKSILRTARARAFMRGRDYVVPEDVTDVIPMTSSHRITLSAKAKAAGRSEKEVLDEIIKSIEMPRF